MDKSKINKLRTFYKVIYILAAVGIVIGGLASTFTMFALEPLVGIAMLLVYSLFGLAMYFGYLAIVVMLDVAEDVKDAKYLLIKKVKDEQVNKEVI